MANYKLRPPPMIRSLRELSIWALDVGKWMYELYRSLSQTGILEWNAVDKSRANLADLANRDHQSLQNVKGADGTDTGITQDKHVSNVQAKYWNDHVSASTNVHGIGETASVVGTTTSQVLSNKRMDSSNKYGGTANYAEFEADGTLHFVGDATVFRDELGDVSRLKVLGVGISFDDAESTLDFATNANLSDYVVSNYQLNHDWEAGSSIFPHIHYWQTNNAAPNFLIRYRWQKDGQAKTTAWTDLPCVTQAFTYAANINQIAYNSTGIPAPVGYGISDILQIRIFRDNANTSTAFAGADAYTGDAEVTAIDVHIECDTFGSRTQFSK